MRKIFFTVLIALAIIPASIHAGGPVISPAPGNPDADTNGDVWYYIQFQDIYDLVVLDADLVDDWGVAAAFPVKDKENQLWKLTQAETGTNDTIWYSLVNKAGEELLYLSRYFNTGVLVSSPKTLFYVETLTDGSVRLYRKGRPQPDRTITRFEPGTNYNLLPIGSLELLVYEQASTDSLRFVLPRELVYPTTYFKTSENQEWYYIQYAKSGKVIQDNGENRRLTAETAVENKDAQLWQISYDEDVTFAGSALKSGTYSIVNKSTGNKIFYSGGAIPTGGSEIVRSPDGDGFYSLSGKANYAAATPPRKCDITLTGTAKFATSSNLTGAYPGFLLRGNWNNKTTTLDYFATANVNDTIARAVVSDDASLNFVPSSEFTFTSLSTVVTEKIKIAPNPAQDYIQLTLPEGVKTITILNTTGQTLTKIHPATATVNIPVANFAPGLYLVSIEKATGVETTKFIKL